MLIPLRILLHFACLLPFGWVGYGLMIAPESVFGADPIKELIHFLGETAIMLFCSMFLLGIIVQKLGLNHYQILRRPLGLWAFFAALLHLLAYLALELGLDLALFVSELGQRPYLILGGIAFVILAIMALTSIPSLKKVLGKHWFQLHQWAYPALACATIHYYWSVKSLTLLPIIIGITTLLILSYRVFSKR